MVKNLFLPILGVIAFIIAVGLFSRNSSQVNIGKYTGFASPAPAVKEIKIGSATVNVEIADTLDKRAKGLSGRNSMDAGYGMLFVFDAKDTPPVFWMKDMRFPLDFIWISADKIVKIDKNVLNPGAGTPDAELLRYSAPVPVDYVLEVNAGFTDKNNIKVGDPVNLTNLGKQ